MILAFAYGFELKFVGEIGNEIPYIELKMVCFIFKVLALFGQSNIK